MQRLLERLRQADYEIHRYLLFHREVKDYFQDSSMHMLIFDKECKYLFVSTYWAQMFGLAPREMEGKHWSDLGQTDAPMQIIEQLVANIFKFGEIQEGETVLYPTKDGINKFKFRLAPLFKGASKRVVAAICTVQDITDKKQTK